jgi:hypothetical protein
MRLHTAEMLFLRAVAGYRMREHKRNEDIREEVGIRIMKNHLSKWPEHLREERP